MSADDFPDDGRASALRAWARGDIALEAAVELLIRFHGGRLLGGCWIRRDEHNGERWDFQAQHTVSEGGYLSGGERRVLAIASSLASPGHPVDLGEAITGIDPDALRCVLGALTYAGGGSRSFEEPGQVQDEPR